MPSHCRIKGNISGGNKIYHTPESSYYSRTEIDTSKGERWFCTVEDALDAGWRPPSGTQTVPTPSCQDGLDLNHADADDLETLPGIGPVLAQRIIDYRSQHGAFTSVDELLDVNGIGDKTFAKIKDCVYVD